MRHAILGPGGVGGLIAASLAQSGASVTLGRAGVHPVVIKDTLHHSKVDLAMNVYDKASAEDIRAALKMASTKLLGSDLLPKDLLPSTPKPG